jgi:hypothetical protein
MDHKQSATPFGWRAGVLYSNWNSCSILERPRKACIREWLPYAPDAGAGLSPYSSQKSPSTRLFSRIGFLLAPRGTTTTFARPFLRLEHARHTRSSCCRDRPALMLLRPQADNDTRQGFFVAGDPLWRNLRGVHEPRGSVNRVPAPRTRSH